MSPREKFYDVVPEEPESDERPYFDWVQAV